MTPIFASWITRENFLFAKAKTAAMESTAVFRKIGSVSVRFGQME
jgi:hypothetical protein